MYVLEDWKTKIWYDALTGKHLRYGMATTKHLQTLKHETILTTRKHPDTTPLANFLKEKPIIIGKYDPESLLTRVKEGAKRQLKFCKLFEKETPRVAISHGSADLCRVAFGLGTKVITTVDTPYAEAVHRLTLPLSDYIVASKAIPKEILEKYNIKGEIIQFNGVDEAAWTKGFEPRTKYHFGKPLIVVRQLEEKAVYSDGKVDMLAIAKKLTKLGNVVFLSRYHRKAVNGLIVPKFVDSTSLVAQADLFIGVGGTIAREAALQGTPAITVKVFSNQQVNDFLAEKGFPIYETTASETVKLAEKLLGKKRDVKNLLNELENPVDVIADIVAKIEKN